MIAVDLQAKMIAGLKRRAAKAGLLNRIDARVTPAETMSINDCAGKVDFTLAFAVVHEFPDPGNFFREVGFSSKSGARVLLAEPRGHVDEETFAAELSAAIGFHVTDQPSIRRSHAALLSKR